MAHQITDIDTVFSVKSPEWHGLATVRKVITKEESPEILAPIREFDEIWGTCDGEKIGLPKHKVVAADLRQFGGTIQPLAVHTDRYHVIQNSSVWDAVTTAMKDVPHIITTAGTLDGYKRFFVCVELTENRGFRAGGDDFRSYLLFVTSHDGSLSLQFYDSCVRVVCANTLAASLSSYAAGNHNIKIKHTRGAEVEMQFTAEVLNSTLQNRDALAENLDQLSEVTIGEEDALRAIAGWQYDRLPVKPDAVKNPKKKARFSTRSQNTIWGIYDLFQNGRGNNGETRYDLLNGVTEYYTSGDGSGKTKPSRQRVSNAQFGSAATLKSDFYNRLTDQQRFDHLLSQGGKALALMDN